MARGLERPPWWAVVVMAVGLAWLAVGLPLGLNRGGEPLSKAELERLDAAAEAANAEDAANAPPDAVVVSVLSDSHAYNAGSWFRRTVEAEQIPGVVAGTLAGTPGADTERIDEQVDQATANADFVLIQGGTNDLLSGDSPQQAMDGVVRLVQDVQARGPVPILMLVPPSDERPDQVVELNDLIRAWAADNGVSVVDDYTVVADDDGTFKDGLTDDGRHAKDPEGTELMARAVLEQLPPMLTVPAAAGVSATD